MKIAVIGDVHGEAAKLADLVADLRRTFGRSPEDLAIYQVGDLIDRGPDSKAVIDFCIAERISAIAGNHELWLRALLSYGPEAAVDACLPAICSPLMGGSATFAAYGVGFRASPGAAIPSAATRPSYGLLDQLRRAVPRAHADWLRALPDFRVLRLSGPTAKRPSGRCLLLTHTGLPASAVRAAPPPVLGPEPETAEMTAERVTKWVRRYLGPGVYFWHGVPVAPPTRSADVADVGPGVIQVFGHTPLETPQVHKHYVAIDTGCGTTEPFQLTAAVFDTDSVQVELFRA